MKFRLPAALLAAVLGVGTLLVPASTSAPTLLETATATATIQAKDIDIVPFEAQNADDGTTLRGHVYLPKDAPRPLGTVLHFAPYFGGVGYSFKNTEEWYDDEEISFLLEAGFAVAAVSMRGTGRSGGCLPFGDARDQGDAYAVVEGLADEPWSNGKVGMYGHSYPGWSSFMAAAAAPPALKTVVPTSGITDLWSLLTRRGAPISGVGSLGFAAFVYGATGPPVGAEGLCPDVAEASAEFTQNTFSGDRSPFYDTRDLRDQLTPSSVPVMTSIGIVSGNDDGHILQLEGMWNRLGADRTRFVLGQWAHEPPTGYLPGWHEQVVAWFDHYLRGAPETVPPGLVQYQDDLGEWHSSDQWPPVSTTRVFRLSRDAELVFGRPAKPFSVSLQSADNDPGLRATGGSAFGREHNSTCGPTQVLFASEPLKKDLHLAGNIDMDLTLASTLPGGNLSVFFWKTSGDGVCPDQQSEWFARGLMDLRHWKTAGTSEDFPIGVATPVSLRSQPFASHVAAGQRIVVAVGGGSAELEPDSRHPVLTVTGGTVRLPAVS